MIGIYFSGTGNTRYCMECFLNEFGEREHCISIEDEKVLEQIAENELIVLGYPVYFSSLPKIMHDFIQKNADAFAGKKVYLLVTMGAFSGDGAGCAARLLRKQKVQMAGALHIKMPDNVGDTTLLKKTLEENRKIVKQAEKKIKVEVQQMKQGKPSRNGLGITAHIAGFFGQRAWFGHKAKHYTDKIKIDQNSCMGCGKCVKLCPMKNLQIKNKKALSGSQCTMCYRCISNCPNKAITLLGNHVEEQCRIERYLS